MPIFNRGLRILLGLALAFASVSARAAATSYSYALLGDAGEWNSLGASVEKSARDAHVLDGILIGDNLYVGTYDQQWTPWFRDGFRFPVVAIGNHHGGYAEEMRYFKMPAEAYTTWIAPGVAAIVLNSDNVATADAQAKFLEKELRTLRAESIFVVYHHPMLTLSAAHSWKEREAFHRAVRPILYKYRKRLSAILNGHDHVAGAFSFGDLPVFLSGAIKEAFPFRSVNGMQENIRVKTEWAYRGRPTWGKLTVHPHSRESTIEFIEANPTRSICHVRVRTGEWLYLGDDCYRPIRGRR
ncbi:MAG: metallophosphoesterase [Bdellovibrionales bacterium]|nr:metallophosphoesterase [Bdellovibrionales bacterium]